MKQYKAAIFDLDGTLLNTLDDIWFAVNHMMDMFGYPRHTKDEVRRFVGNGVDRLIELSVPGGADDPLRDEVIREYRAYYAFHAEDRTKPYEGAADITSKLMKEGIGVAVVSNKPHEATVRMCKKYFPEISVVCGEHESEGIRRKPYPDMVFWAAEKLGCAIEDCVYIGDSEVDLLTAKNAGMDCISVLWGFRDRDELRDAGGCVFAETTDDLYHAVVG